MNRTRRIVMATFLGLICGLISWAICTFAMGHTQSLSVNLVIILLNGLMGFTIGISALKWQWALHGLILGGLFGIVMGFVASSHGDVFIWRMHYQPTHWRKQTFENRKRSPGTV